MNQDPFSDPFKTGLGQSSTSDIFSTQLRRGGGSRRPAKPAGNADPDAAEPEQVPVEEAEKPVKVLLRNPKWETETVGFNEEADISVEVQLPEEHKNKKKVIFELFAKTPDAPERIGQADGFEDGGKAKARVPVYQPNYRDEGGNLLAEVEYYFTAKHSQSDLLQDDKAVKKIDGKADRVIESHVLEDTTFDFDSSFLHPRNASGLKALRERIKSWREKYPEGAVALFGHADAVGQEPYNKGLSERRARSVHAFLVKDVPVWEKLHGEEKWTLKPVQALLQHLGYDPGSVDGVDGPKTQSAVKAFQEKQGLKADGVAGAKTREALFTAFVDEVNDAPVDKKEFEDIAGNPFTGCSEFNLLEETAGACEKNRRVTVLLLKTSKKFPINYPCKPGDLEKCRAQVKKSAGKRRKASFKCFFYDDLVKEEGGGGGGGGVAPDNGGTLKLVFPAEKIHTQYVNLPSDGKAHGGELKVEVAVDGGKEGQKVFWTLAPAKENSKRNDPKTGVKPKGALVEFTEKPLEVETELKGGKSDLILVCGVAGKESFDIKMGLKKDKQDLALQVVTSRKLWYQYTRDENLDVPKAELSEAAFVKVGVESIQAKTVTFKKADAPARTYYPEWIINPGGADKEVAVIGSHNKEEFQKKFKVEAAEPLKAHLIICEHQWDEGDETKKISVTMKKREVEDLVASEAIFNPALSGPLVVSGTWTSLAPAGHADHGKSGDLTDDWILVKKNRPNRSNVSLKVPAGKPVPSAAAPVKVVFTLRGVDGPFLGESGAPHMLIVYDSSDVTDFNNTVTHEIGHGISQTPGPAAQSPGLANHPRYYIEHGGIGPHCHTDKNAAGEFVDGTVVEVPDPEDDTKKVKEYATGVCVMFHQGDKRCINEFCPACEPYVRATDLSGFEKA